MRKRTNYVGLAVALAGLAVLARAHPVAMPGAASGDPGVALADLARFAGLWVSVSDGRMLQLASARGRTIWVEADRGSVLADGARIFLGEPVRRSAGRWWVGRVDAVRLLGPILEPGRIPGMLDVDWNEAALDPGHGGMDSGTSSADGMEEKNRALEIALRVRRRLEAAGVRVFMTRDADVQMELDARIASVNRRRPFAFVSIHLNGAQGSAAEGIETYILSKAGQPSTNTLHPGAPDRYPPAPGNGMDAANAVLGFGLHREMLRRTGASDRGLRQARFQLLREVRAPAALVECGFLTHPEEAERLQDDAYLDRAAAAIADGILLFRGAGLRARAARVHSGPEKPEKFFLKKKRIALTTGGVPLNSSAFTESPIRGSVFEE